MSDSVRLREQAAKCRRLARTSDDAKTSQRLNDLAREYEAAAAQMDAQSADKR
jgi:hypothetical protein